jgi:hypothetical protein
VVISFYEAVANSRRYPYTLEELNQGATLVRLHQSLGLDTRPHELMLKTEAYLTELLEGGVFILSSRELLNQDFVLLKVDGGMTFLGRQRAIFRLLYGSVREARLECGPAYKSFVKALAIVSDQYRRAGHQAGNIEKAVKAQEKLNALADRRRLERRYR